MDCEINLLKKRLIFNFPVFFNLPGLNLRKCHDLGRDTRCLEGVARVGEWEAGRQYSIRERTIQGIYNIFFFVVEITYFTGWRRAP